MNKYETIFIIDPTVEEAGIKELVKKFSDLINSDGKVEKVEEKGKLKLAYEIKKNKEGYYVVINFEAKPSLIAELERVYRITDNVLKFMTIRVEEKDVKEVKKVKEEKNEKVEKEEKEVKAETKSKAKKEAKPEVEPEEVETEPEVEPETEEETDSESK